jgi:ligand-binding sensor domain-containing protein
MLNSGLADDLVTDIGEDYEGHLWFSTADGVSRLKRLRKNPSIVSS